MTSGQREGDPQYQSYLLRLWRTHSGGVPVWRASLENLPTQEIQRFDSLPDLCAFLWAQTGQRSRGGGWDGEISPAPEP